MAWGTLMRRSVWLRCDPVLDTRFFLGVPPRAARAGSASLRGRPTASVSRLGARPGAPLARPPSGPPHARRGYAAPPFGSLPLCSARSVTTLSARGDVPCEPRLSVIEAPGRAWCSTYGASSHVPFDSSSANPARANLHVAATEGVFIETESGGLEWHTLREPSSADVADIAWDTCLRVTRVIQRRGLDVIDRNDDIDELAVREPLLAACYSASIGGFIATLERPTAHC